jgi:hypothetical protein
MVMVLLEIRKRGRWVYKRIRSVEGEKFVREPVSMSVECDAEKHVTLDEFIRHMEANYKID